MDTEDHLLLFLFKRERLLEVVVYVVEGVVFTTACGISDACSSNKAAPSIQLYQQLFDECACIKRTWHQVEVIIFNCELNNVFEFL